MPANRRRRYCARSTLFCHFNAAFARTGVALHRDQLRGSVQLALWADISPASEIVLEQNWSNCASDLALLPAPFFDRRDSTKLVLPFVLPANPSNDMMRSAAVIASWFGVQADYRARNFPSCMISRMPIMRSCWQTAATLPPGSILPGSLARN